MRALLCPASLKGVLSARRAAAALARGVRAAGGDAVELPIADGGEGNGGGALRRARRRMARRRRLRSAGRPVPARWLVLPDGRAVIEAASAIGLPLLARGERDPLVASSRGLGELVLAALGESPRALFVGLGGSATVDGGAGLREVLRALPLPTTVLCDVRTTLADAARLFGPQKGATPATVPVLERRLAAMEELAPYAALPGAGAAGGLGAALAALGARLVEGAPAVLDLIGFDDAPSWMRPRGDGRGSGRSNHCGGKGTRRGCAAMRGGRRSLRRVRRARRRARRGYGDGQPVRRPCERGSRPRRARRTSRRANEIQRRRAGRPSTRASSRRPRAETRRTA